MAINIFKFDAKKAYTEHEGTILALPVLPQGMKAPFSHQYGYLMNSGTMAGHAHTTDEIYIVLSGSGYVVLGGKNKAVKAGDVISIPHDVWHTMVCTDKDEAPFLWAALWWKPVEGGAAPTDEIDVLAFSKETAHKAHLDTILAQDVVPASIETPFSHAYGYLDNGGSMEYHKHEAPEAYIVFSGTGTITIDGEDAEVGPGDVIEIPSNLMHTMTGKPGEPFLWAAIWWPRMA